MFHSAPPPFQHPADSRWIDLWFEQLDARLVRAFHATPVPDGPIASLPGLILTPTDVERLLSSPTSPIPGPAGFLADPERSPWRDLRAAFSLEPFDLDVLAIVLAVEFDVRYQRIFAWLQDDLTRLRPTINLVLDLLCTTRSAKYLRRRNLTADSTLRRSGLLSLIDDATTPELAQPLVADRNLLAWLLGTSVMQPHADHPGNFTTSAYDLADLPLPPSLREGLNSLAARSGAGERVILGGFAGYGQQEIAASLASRWGCSLLAIDSSLLSTERSLARQQLETMLRTARLTRSAIFIDGPWDTENASVPLVTAIAEATDHLPLPVLIASSALPPSVSGIRLEVPAPDVAARAAWWDLALEDVNHRVNADTVARLSHRYQLRPAHILDAVASARAQARWHQRTEILAEDLVDAAQMQTSLHLDRLAQKRSTSSAWSWEDLVLPADQMTQLREIHNHAQLRHLLHDHWKTPHLRHAAPGINVLFSGPSGTGKTMAAEVLAGALGLDLYTIDVPNTISKYVGEMEKNIDRIFRAAYEGNVVLFFDEADAWFGKRSQVREANDRYANVEVSYLLQRIESHDGVVILGTNLRSNMDDAFTRRLHHVVEFPFPDSALRERLWRKHLAGTGALDADVDPRFLATQFEIAGGSIRAIATNAAFLAAANDQAITMHHLIRATRREFQKLGRVCDATTFGRAIDYLEPVDSREAAS